MSKTHINISGKCIADAYRGGVFYMKGDKHSYDYPIYKGVKGLPAWFEISEESLKDLEKAEKELKAEKEKSKAKSSAVKAKASNKAPEKEEQSLV